MDKEKIKKELDALIREGRDIHYAATLEYDKDYLKKAGFNELEQQVAKDALKKIIDPKRTYHSWYDKAYEMVRIVFPRRLDQFKDFYTGTHNRDTSKDLTRMTAGITHYLQGHSITLNGKLEGFFYNFNIGLNQQRNILIAIRNNFDYDFFNLETDIRHDIYKSAMDIAKEIQEEDSRIAGAIASVMLEVHLKKIAVKHGIEDKENNSIADYNNFLKTKGVYDSILADQIKPCRKIRNKCVHTNQGDPSVGEVSTIIHIADRVIAEVN